MAIVVLAWLAVMERDARLEARGSDAARRAHATSQLLRADADLRAAKLLNPGTAPDVSRAFAYRANGRPCRAIALLEEVVRREPDNVDAWGALYGLARGMDARAVRRALTARRRLDPINAR